MSRFSPPGNLKDLVTPEQLDSWSNVIETSLEDGISRLEGSAGKPAQLVNPFRHDTKGFQERFVPWLTAPQTTNDQRRRAEARSETDRVDMLRDLQDEYSEWYTHRDTEGRVVAVDVTTELPEYWTHLAQQMPREDFVGLYKLHIDSAVTERDLFPDGASYLETNRWNTTGGAMHMIQGINRLNLAIDLIVGALVWRLGGGDEGDVDSAIDCQDCSEFTMGHHADPTIIGHFNRLAREGRFITLKDPIGVYILGIDTDGWVTPDGSDPRALIETVRGEPPVRVRIREPRGRFALSEVTIGGEPIVSGSQIAERTTVGLRAMVGPPGQVRPAKGSPCTKRGALPAAAGMLESLAPRKPFFWRSR